LYIEKVRVILKNRSGTAGVRKGVSRTALEFSPSVSVKSS
jgi:hypothetical protein